MVVVDNGSTDETPRRLASLAASGRVKVVTLPENVGFVRGNNAGIAAAAPGSDVVLLNNDLVFTQEDWLARLAAVAAGDPTIGIVGCRLRLPDGRLLHAGTYILPDSVWGQPYHQEEARAFKQRLKAPLILVGGIRSYAVAERLVNGGVCDFISMSRPFIREPGLVNRWKSGDRKPAACASDNLCYGPIRKGDGFYCVTAEKEKSKG